MAAEFVLGVGDHSYLAPSLPIPEASNQPTDEMRGAALTVEGEASVHISYRHFYATGDIDIIGVSNLPHA